MIPAYYLTTEALEIRQVVNIENRKGMFSSYEKSRNYFYGCISFHIVEYFVGKPGDAVLGECFSGIEYAGDCRGDNL